MSFSETNYQPQQPQGGEQPQVHAPEEEELLIKR